MGFYEYFFGEDKPEDDLEKTQKGMGYGELILDNVVGLDNEYDSFGEKLGRYINEDEIGFLKETGRGMYEGAKDFVQAPIETTKEAVRDVVDSTKALFTQDLDDRLMDMYGVDITNATGDQITTARESILGDALNASSLIPAAGAGAMGVRAVAKNMPEYDPTMVGSNLGNVFATAKDAANQTEEMLDIDRRVDTRLPTTPEEKGGDAREPGSRTGGQPASAQTKGGGARAGKPQAHRQGPDHREDRRRRRPRPGQGLRARRPRLDRPEQDGRDAGGARRREGAQGRGAGGGGEEGRHPAGDLRRDDRVGADLVSAHPMSG